MLEYAKFSEVLADEEMRAIEAEVKYEGYLKLQRQEVEKLARMDDVAVPESLDFRKVPGLTQEAMTTLEKSRPTDSRPGQGNPGCNPGGADKPGYCYKTREKADQKRECST